MHLTRFFFHCCLATLFLLCTTEQLWASAVENVSKNVKKNTISIDNTNEERKENANAANVINAKQPTKRKKKIKKRLTALVFNGGASSNKKNNSKNKVRVRFTEAKNKSSARKVPVPGMPLKNMSKSSGVEKRESLKALKILPTIALTKQVLVVKKKNNSPTSPTIINDVENYYNDLEEKRESLTSLHAVHLPTIAWTVQKRKQTRKQKQKHLVEHPAVPTNIKIIIDDLPCMTTKLQLKQYFSKFGTIKNCMSTKIEINAGCVVVLLNEKQQKYGESIHKKLTVDVNLQTQICYCDPKKVLGVVERVQNSGAKYCCVVGEKVNTLRTTTFIDDNSSPLSNIAFSFLSLEPT